MRIVLLALLDLPIILGGHGYDVGREQVGGAGADDGGGGIDTMWIVAAVVLALVTVGLLLWLGRKEKPGEGARALNLRLIAPVGAIAAIITIPLIMWTLFSGGGDEESLIVERWTNDSGAPELIVSLVEADLNNLDTTNGKTAVRLTCLGLDGQVLLDADQQWPFINDDGYEYPHAHQAASVDQVQQANRCQLDVTHVTLEAEVRGAL